MLCDVGNMKTPLWDIQTQNSIRGWRAALNSWLEILTQSPYQVLAYAWVNPVPGVCLLEDLGLLPLFVWAAGTTPQQQTAGYWLGALTNMHPIVGLALCVCS